LDNVARLKITWVKSLIGHDGRQRRIIRSLGLRRLNQSVVHEESPTIAGMLVKVQHLVQVEPMHNEGKGDRHDGA
jgi:large subunit ribosomal protein L30